MTRLSKPWSSSTVGANHTEENGAQIDLSARPIRLVVAERSSVLRLGFSQFVENRVGLELIGEAATLKELLALSATLKPDVILLDLYLARSDDFQAARDIKAFSPSTQILICGESEEIDDIRSAFDISVRGYMLKQANFEEVYIAIRQVHAGLDYISEALAERLLENMARENAGPVGS